MDRNTLRDLLNQLADGRASVDRVLGQLETLPYEDLGFARLDHHRALRCGSPEVIFGQGKTPEHIAAIFARLAARNVNVLATRVAPEAAELVLERFPQADYNRLARTVALRQTDAERTPDECGYVAVVSAGTSDLPVAEEARVTAEILGAPTRSFHDVGVAGVHRLFGSLAEIRAANVIIVVAGMEGALPSVVGGLVARPVIAVPTSVGYGASFGGLSALLTSLNTCASGVSVVNIDNGFGAGFQAALINRLAAKHLHENSTDDTTQPAETKTAP